VKCSLLTLSTFIDDELAPQRRAEVDAHLVGCARCSAGAATLRDERSRIGQLARVTIDPGSAQLMLEQVGIAVGTMDERSPLPPRPEAPADEHRPWQGGTSSAALPWTPRRPEAVAQLPSAPATAPDVAVDLQADLPLDGVRAAPPSWKRPARPPAPPDGVDDLGIGPDDAVAETAWTDADEQWLNGGEPAESWEADLPPPAEPMPPSATTWTPPEPPGDVEPRPVATAPETSLPAPQPDPPLYAQPPTRLAAASGPAAVWARLRDAVSVRLALSHGTDALDDTVQIVSGTGRPRAADRPVVDMASASAPPVPHPPSPVGKVELDGLAGAARAPEITGEAPPAALAVPAPLPPAPDVAALDDPAAWNAFAASSYPEASTPEAQPAPEARAPRQLGRHSRAVARDQVPLSTRLTRGTAAVALALRTGAAATTASVRSRLTRVRATGPDSRLLAGIAVVGLIFVLALIIGHSSSRPTAPAARRPSTATTAPQRSAPAVTATGAAAAAVAPAPAPVQTFGAGGTGFQVLRLRYGAQAGYERTVFDIAGAAGTPKVTAQFTTPTTLTVTFAGTAPAGPTVTPNPGRVISSVTLVSTSGGRSVYRFTLTRAATITAFYLASPTRFVLDVH
jgi:hypothetical protein